MSSDFQNTKQPCLVCGEVRSSKILLGEDLADASDFREVNESSKTFYYELDTCETCGHTFITTDNPCLLPTRKHKFIKYGEPVEHYPNILIILESIEIDFSDTSIHTFSYKDFRLANFLSHQLGIVDVNLVDWLGCSDDWIPQPSIESFDPFPERLQGLLAEIENSNRSHKIVIMTRFFDHVDSPELLKRVINIASSNVHVVFDLNDYERLFALRTLEFIWNERRNFFQKTHLEHILTSASKRFTTFTYESLEVSPTLTGVISHRLPTREVSCEPSIYVRNSPDLCGQLTILRNRWRDVLAKEHKLGIIGASHKGVSLAQFVLDNHVAYSLHDDKEALRGKIPPVAPPLGFHPVSGFDFSEYTHIAITTTLVIAAKIIPKLRASGYEGEISDFDCRKLD